MTPDYYYMKWFKEAEAVKVLVEKADESQNYVDECLENGDRNGALRWLEIAHPIYNLALSFVESKQRDRIRFMYFKTMLWHDHVAGASDEQIQKTRSFIKNWTGHEAPDCFPQAVDLANRAEDIFAEAQRAVKSGEFYLAAELIEEAEEIFHCVRETFLKEGWDGFAKDAIERADDSAQLFKKAVLGAFPHIGAS